MSWWKSRQFVENEKRLEKWSIGVRHTYEISSSKHQITNKSQIPILNDQNRFGPPQADWSLLFV
jgi:hypothetical protein